MNAERWKQIDEIFAAVLEIPETGREKFLAQSCHGDDDLKSEVLSLLEAAPRAGDFMEISAMRVAANRLAAGHATAANDYFSGKIIGIYKIEKSIGAGGMGEVYLAWDEKLQRKVALKILPAEYTSDDERVKRFELEAKAISILNHPNIVTIFDVGTTAENVNYIACEYVEGRTLRELAGESPKIKDVLDIIIQACEALTAAHSAGIVHRDIKPENIMIRPDGYAKILDFGVAKLNRADPHAAASANEFAKTARGVIVGTPAYMSPAQIGGERIDHRTDLWSLGVVFYELLTGANPFKRENRQATFQAILTEDAPPPSSINSEISPDIDRILIKALERDADLSYQTATDLRADLKRIRRALDSPAASISARSGNVKSAARRNYLSYAAVLLLPLLAFGIWHLASRATEQPAVQTANEWATARNLQLTDSPWVEGYPSISPDGKNIVFASEVAGDGNIYLQRIGGRTQQNLTPDSKRRDTMPAFSPDGNFIAFRSERDSPGIYVMGATGENARRVSDIGYHPSWSPDGKKIVVSDKFAAVHTAHSIPNSSLWTIDAATGEKQKLETKGDAIMPSWSPNGERIAFWFVADGKPGEIATVAAGGGEPTVIASDASAADWNPVWSPDGKYLYFASNRVGNMNFWRVRVDEKTGRQTGVPESVSTPSKYCRHLALSRDGKILVYVRYESKSNLQSIRFDPQTLETAGEANWITRGNSEIGNPQMSPDGEKFLVRNPDNTEENLAVFDKDGGNRRILMNDQFRERLPRWSPDGKRVAFQTDRTGKFQIWTIDADGSNARQITFTEKDGAVAAVFSPDGTRMIFTEVNGDSRKPFLLDLSRPWARQTPQPLVSGDANVSFSPRDWSKDGKKLLVAFFESGGEESGIAVFDFETAKYEKITDTGATPFWLKDNRHFIFTSQNTIYLADAKTKKIRELYKPSAYELQHANVSPDNRMIFFRYLQVDADIWLLDAAPNE